MLVNLNANAAYEPTLALTPSWLDALFTLDRVTCVFGYREKKRLQAEAKARFEAEEEEARLAAEAAAAAERCD